MMTVGNLITLLQALNPDDEVTVGVCDDAANSDGGFYRVSCFDCERTLEGHGECNHCQEESAR